MEFTMRRKVLFVLAVTCALSFATLFFASVVFGSLFRWLENLSPQSQHLIPILSAIATGVFALLGVILRRRATPRA